MHRVVVTGMGTVNPLGIGVKRSWEALVSGKSGIVCLSHQDFYGGEIRDFSPLDFMDKKTARRFDSFIHYGLAASVEAIEQSGVEASERVGVLIGSALGNLKGMEEGSSRGGKKLSPFTIPGLLGNMCGGLVSIRYGFKGINIGITSACSTGLHSIGEGYWLIRTNRCDAVVVGGSEAPLCRFGLEAFHAACALSRGYCENPQAASRPWDVKRDGFVMSEGAGVLVLESYDHALKRGAEILAEVGGYGASCDAYHVTAPEASGEGGRRAMEEALRSSGLCLSDIGYINAHATSTPLGDETELKALTKLWGKETKRPLVSSTKSATGHLLGAAGGLEAIFAIQALRTGIAPATLNLQTPPQSNIFDLVPLSPREGGKFKAVLSNSFGFGGTNGCIIFKKL